MPLNVTHTVICPHAKKLLSSFNPSFDEANQAKRSGSHIMVVAMGQWLDMDELTAIASYPPEANIIRVDSYSDLIEYSGTIAGSICNSKYIARTTSGGLCLSKAFAVKRKPPA